MAADLDKANQLELLGCLNRQLMSIPTTAILLLLTLKVEDVYILMKSDLELLCDVHINSGVI